MHVQTVLVDKSWLHNVWKMFYFLLNSSLSGKMVFLRKLKLIYPSNPKKLLGQPPFKKEGRDYAFYMRDYKGVAIKLLPFYMTDFLFTELWSHNIWTKLKNRMKNDIPNIQYYLHTSDPNLL